jgi:hypothetical protein
MTLLIHFGLCRLPYVYMCFKQAYWMDGTTSMKHDMLSFVDIGMKGFNKGVGFTMRVYFLRI